MRKFVDNIRRSLKGLVRRNPKLRRAYHRLRGRLHQARLTTGTAHRTDGVSPENIVWIFGSGRSGSTWLRSMMAEMKHHRVWEEPMVGRLFGDFHARAQGGNLLSSDFIMGDPIRRGWIQSIRTFVLDGIRLSHPRLTPNEYLIVKEPNGSTGAPLLMEALPESRMILLVRDPRDAVASSLDGAKGESWLHEWRGGDQPNRQNLADERPDRFVRRRADSYRRHMTKAREAYEAHRGRKTLVRYEDLRTDTPGTMTRIYSELGIFVQEKDLAQAVERHSWERLPESEKGAGKFYRKGAPGGWRDDLTPEQARTVEEITGPLLRKFYPEDPAPRA